MEIKKELWEKISVSLFSDAVSLNNFVKVLHWTGFCVDPENGLSESQRDEFDVFWIVFSKVLFSIEP